MGTSDLPGHGELSQHEKQVLALIEHDLATSDPAFARRMQVGVGASGRVQPRPVAGHGVVAASVLVVLLVVALMPQSWQSVLGLALTLGLLPALLLRTTARGTPGRVTPPARGSGRGAGRGPG
jgi:hypothetical protein